MDIEGALVAKALTSGEFPEVISRGIEPDHFYDDDVRDVYEFSLDFMQEHAQPPSMQAVKRAFPGFKVKLSQDPLSWHMEQFVRHVKENKAVELVRAYHEALEDPDEIDEIELRALEMARELTEVIPSPKAQRFSEGKQRKKEYERRKREGVMHGILLGIPTFDAITLGAQPHELIVGAGYMGVGKTTLMQHVAMSAYLQRKTSLFVSLEVEAEQILRKFDVMLADIRYRALKALELDVGEEEKWTKVLEAAERERLEHDIIIRDDIKNCTIDKVLAETIRYKPSIVFVDYLELMKVRSGGGNSSHWEKVSEAGMGLKQNARVLKVPHMTAAQLNRDAGNRKAGGGEVTLATLGYQSIGKHADMLIGLQQDEENELRNEMKLILLKYRDGPSRKHAMMQWNLDRMQIKEKGIEDRFQTRDRKPLSSRERTKEQKLELAARIGGRENPITARLAKRKSPRRSSHGKRKKQRQRTTA